MKITVLGWYGTETIGDRAILAGLISLFNKSYKSFEIRLGSLNPFFSQRTINEDYCFYKEIVGQEITIELFNSKSSTELFAAIKESDLVLMGGGPLMDLNELFMIEYAFKKAKKAGVKTALLGCGIGPLFHKKYRRSVLNISSNSDLIILRDSKSKISLKNIYAEFDKPFQSEKISVSYDPAVECVLEFKRLNKKIEQDYIAINLRDFPAEYGKNCDCKSINEKLKAFVKDVALKYCGKDIRLVPMHYFHIGGDDRVFLNSIALELKLKNIHVQNTNLTLKETIECFQNANFNIGMRFHSVVLQVIVSGKNCILDYTEPKKGKISSFLSDIDNVGFYNNRYIALQESQISSSIMLNDGDEFHIDESMVRERLKVYIDNLVEFVV